VVISGLAVLRRTPSGRPAREGCDAYHTAPKAGPRMSADLSTNTGSRFHPNEAASCPPRRVHPQGDPLPRLEHAGLTEEHGVKDAERLPDFGPTAGCQGRWCAVAVHLPGPTREHGDRGVADVLPDLRGALVQAQPYAGSSTNTDRR